MSKIIQNKENCIGCNSCIEYAPDYWKIGEDGKAILKRSTGKNSNQILEVEDFELEKNKLAAEACPMGCIQILDDNGKVIK
ncbi:MAG: ferredoxin [Candidatus Magasanikbacteria bacterium]|nr:ferredoxin [Candidatus Magasanikbacteria bacterium]